MNSGILKLNCLKSAKQKWKKPKPKQQKKNPKPPSLQFRYNFSSKFPKKTDQIKQEKEKEEWLNLGNKFFMKYFLVFVLQEFTVWIHFLNSYLRLCQGGYTSPVTVFKKSTILIYFLSFTVLILNLRGTMRYPQVSYKKQKCRKTREYKSFSLYTQQNHGKRSISLGQCHYPSFTADTKIVR